MKKQKKNKLTLIKVDIANLNNVELLSARGGTGDNRPSNQSMRCSGPRSGGDRLATDDDI